MWGEFDFPVGGIRVSRGENPGTQDFRVPKWDEFELCQESKSNDLQVPLSDSNTKRFIVSVLYTLQ